MQWADSLAMLSEVVVKVLRALMCFVVEDLRDT
jgi:hypothetical protein